MESAKATPPSQEIPYPPVISYPGPFNSPSYPPPGPPSAYPSFFPPPLDCTHAEGTQNGGPPQPYMTYVPPPSVMYAYPHTQPQGFGAQPAAIPVPAILSRPKRKQFTNSAGACKRCDETRFCARCLRVKYGIGDTCVDGQRKERKKGIKRGPLAYKRKNKDGDSPNFSGDWSPGSQPPWVSTTATDPLFDTTDRCLPENDGPPLSTLAEDIWKAMLTWAESKRKNLVQTNHNGYKLRLEKRVLEVIHRWARHSGEDALRRAEYTLEKRSFKPTDIEQHIKQLLELMEQEYWRECWEFTSGVRSTLTLPWHREMFKEMFKEIPSLIEMHRRRLRYFTLEAQLSDTLDKILRLSSGTPSSTHNKNLRELSRNALLILEDLGGDKKYHDELRKRKNKDGYSPNFSGDWSTGSQPLSASTAAADPPSDTTECLPENDGPPLSTLAEDLWKAMLTWAESKRENIMQTNHDTNDLEVIEKRALEMILSWARRSGRDVLKRAEDALEKRRVKPTNIEQHIEQLLKLMDQEYWHGTVTPFMWESTFWSTLTLPSRKEMFGEMLKEIPTLIVHQRLGLRYFTLEAQLSNRLDKILRLSSWTPSSTHNKHLHELLRNALLMLEDLGGNKEYHDDLRNFMKQHTAFCAFTLDNAYAITAEDSQTTTDLCRNLRRLAQNLGKIASTKAEQYQKLYENFIAHKEELSHLLDSASPGQGRSLVDNFTNSLKDMASSMRREADFWNSQSIQFHKWPDIRQTYGSALESMPPFPSEQLNDDRSSTTPPIHGPGSVIQNTESDPQHVPQAAQQVLATFADLQKLRVNTTQAFLVKSENAISKRMRETRGYLELVVNVFERQLSRPSEGCMPLSIVIARLAEKALCITKRWNKLQRKVKFWSSILSIFSKPYTCQTLPKFDMISGISVDDFSCRVIATPDTPIHPYLIELEICLRKMVDHFLSRTHFWARVDSDPATFTSWRLAVLNEI